MSAKRSIPGQYSEVRRRVGIPQKYGRECNRPPSCVKVRPVLTFWAVCRVSVRGYKLKGWIQSRETWWLHRSWEGFSLGCPRVGLGAYVRVRVLNVAASPTLRRFFISCLRELQASRLRLINGVERVKINTPSTFTMHKLSLSYVPMRCWYSWLMFPSLI